MNMTTFKREIMKTLIDDDSCLEKLIELRNKKEFDRYGLEVDIKKLNLEIYEVNELIKFLRTDIEETKP